MLLGERYRRLRERAAVRWSLAAYAASGAYYLTCFHNVSMGVFEVFMAH